MCLIRNCRSGNYGLERPTPGPRSWWGCTLLFRYRTISLRRLENTDNFDLSIKNQNILHTHRHLEELRFMKLILALRIFMSHNLIHPHQLQARECHRGGITRVIRLLCKCGVTNSDYYGVGKWAFFVISLLGLVNPAFRFSC